MAFRGTTGAMSDPETRMDRMTKTLRQKLIEVGFSEIEVRKALVSHGGDITKATKFLMAQRTRRNSHSTPPKPRPRPGVSHLVKEPIKTNNRPGTPTVGARRPPAVPPRRIPSLVQQRSAPVIKRSKPAFQRETRRSSPLNDTPIRVVASRPPRTAPPPRMPPSTVADDATTTPVVSKQGNPGSSWKPTQQRLRRDPEASESGEGKETFLQKPAELPEPPSSPVEERKNLRKQIFTQGSASAPEKVRRSSSATGKRRKRKGSRKDKRNFSLFTKKKRSATKHRKSRAATIDIDEVSPRQQRPTRSKPNGRSSGDTMTKDTLRLVTKGLGRNLRDANDKIAELRRTVKEMEDKIKTLEKENRSLKYQFTNQKQKSKSEQQMKTWFLEYNEVKIENILGSGGYGVVCEATWRGAKVAMKQLKLGGINQKELLEFYAEAKKLSGIRPHPNITTFLGITKQPLCVVMELIRGGDLFSKLHDKKFTLHPKITLRIMRGAAAGLLHLHTEGVVHRDIAARNILLTRDYQVKITDFGYARIIGVREQSATKQSVGPCRWMAPETIMPQKDGKRIYSRKSDIWMFGVLLWEMFYRHKPYYWIKAESSIPVEVFHRTLQLPLPGSMPEVSRMLSACLNYNAEYRPTIENLLENISCLHEEHLRTIPPGGIGRMFESID